MLKFSKLKKYQLLQIQEDSENMLKKNSYIKDLNDKEIEDIKHYQLLFKRISDELEDIDL
jgi:hypothetical protein